MYSDSGIFGFGLLLGILIWLGGAAIAFFVSYWTIRLAVFHAMKAHTRWLQTGQR